MNVDFWLDKWSTNQIGFHQEKWNYFLVNFWSRFSSPTQTVFVPLCGKSHDMNYFLSLGHKVWGIELADTAILDYFRDANIDYEKKSWNNTNVFTSQNISLVQGDIFKIPTLYQGTHLIYDRAALIALSPEQRINYIEFMNKNLPKNSIYFLITIDFELDSFTPPPHPLKDSQILEYFSNGWDLLFKNQVRTFHQKFEMEITNQCHVFKKN